MTERVDIGDWCTLYHADSTEIVDTLRAHKPDAVIMDPPYGIGWTQSAGEFNTKLGKGVRNASRNTNSGRRLHPRYY